MARRWRLALLLATALALVAWRRRQLAANEQQFGWR